MKSHVKTVFVGAISEDKAKEAPQECWFLDLDKLRAEASYYSKRRFKFYELTVEMTVTDVRQIGRQRKAQQP